MRFVKNLPPSGRSRRSTDGGEGTVRYQEEANKLRSRPGQWALLKTYAKHGAASAFVTETKKGKYVAFRPAGSFDAVSRKRGDKTNVYVRYTGK